MKKDDVKKVFQKYGNVTYFFIKEVPHGGHYFGYAGYMTKQEAILAIKGVCDKTFNGE